MDFKFDMANTQPKRRHSDEQIAERWNRIRDVQNPKVTLEKPSKGGKNSTGRRASNLLQIFRELCFCWTGG